jgi:ABC-type uncharacterized transport system auxiliary subunit
MAMNITKKTRVICLLFIAICLSACGGLTQSDKPAVTTWWLNPFTGVAQTANPEIAASILVLVAVVPGLDTDQILTLSDDSELKPYVAARWVDNLPELTTSLVNRTLEASGRFELISERARAGYKRCDLQLEVREFYANLNSSGLTSSVQVTFDGRYICESGTPVDIRLKALVPVQDNRMTVIVAAFQQAVDSVLRELLVQLP